MTNDSAAVSHAAAIAQESRRSPRLPSADVTPGAPCGARNRLVLFRGHVHTEQWRQWHSGEIMRVSWDSAARMPLRFLLRALLDRALLPSPSAIWAPTTASSNWSQSAAPAAHVRSCVLRGTLPLLVCTHPCHVKYLHIALVLVDFCSAIILLLYRRFEAYLRSKLY